MTVDNLWHRGLAVTNGGVVVSTVRGKVQVRPS